MTRDLAQLDSDLTGLQRTTIENITRIDTNIFRIFITQQLNYAEFGKLKKAYDDSQTAQNEIWKKITGSLTGVALSFTVLTAALTIFKIDIALFKLDEHGITILGVTREFPWKKRLDKLQKIIESDAQKKDRENMEDMEKTVKEIKRRLEIIGAASRDRQTDPTKKTDRGIDTSRPLVRGVVTDVKILRAALDQLAAAF